jgi:zinc transporter, ZIP family
VSLSQTLVLGVIAGGTIVLGLPIGRLRSPAVATRVLFNAGAIGVLLFLFWDVLAVAWEPLAASLADVHDGSGSGGRALALGGVFAAGLVASLFALVSYERWMSPAAASGPTRSGPGVMSTTEAAVPRGLRSWPVSLQVAMMIAIGIGLHNFAEGLAIGQSAGTGQIGLATVLVIGFALHNATEGFGIVAPLAADPQAARPGWGMLALFAFVGGGPTLVGTLIGHSFTNDYLSVAFLSLAAGSILYVVIQLLGVAQRARRSELLVTGIITGLLAGFATDALVTLAGA